MKYTEQALFDRLATLEGEKLVQSEDIKQLKKDFKYNKKTNLDGLPPEVVALVSKAAVIHARNVYEEQCSAAKAIFDKYEELAPGYND
jgi:ABC-type multidrug transport system ATPase subunit